MHPAPDAKFWYRLWSVQLLIIGAALNGVGAVIYVLGYLTFFQVHPFMLLGLSALVSAAALVARLVDQPKVPNE